MEEIRSSRDDLFYLLRAAHRSLEIAIDQIATDNSVLARSRLFALFCADWRSHEATEEDLLFPRMRHIPALKEMAQCFQAELDDIERVMRELEIRRVGTEVWVEHFEELRDLVALHIDGVEQEGFRLMRKHLPADVLEVMNDEFRARADTMIRELPFVA